MAWIYTLFFLGVNKIHSDQMSVCCLMHGNRKSHLDAINMRCWQWKQGAGQWFAACVSSPEARQGPLDDSSTPRHPAGKAVISYDEVNEPGIWGWWSRWDPGSGEGCRPQYHGRPYSPGAHAAPARSSGICPHFPSSESSSCLWWAWAVEKQAISKFNILVHNGMRNVVKAKCYSVLGKIWTCI